MPVQKLYYQSYDRRFGLPKDGVRSNVLSEDVCLARDSESDLAQKMGSQPEERVSTSLPFVHIGTDYAGPIHVKEGSSVKKAYVCVFTCASSRMVHLELTNGLTTDEFLQAFSRMTNRRGLCHTVW